MSAENPKTLGQVAYEAYWKTHFDRFNAWKDLDQHLKDNYEHAARAVIEAGTPLWVRKLYEARADIRKIRQAATKLLRLYNHTKRALHTFRETATITPNGEKTRLAQKIVDGALNSGVDEETYKALHMHVPGIDPCGVEDEEPDEPG